MKILGEKSLSAVIRIFLIILLVLCTLVILTGAVIVIKDLNFYINTNLGRSLLLMYISTIPAEVLIIQFIGIFKSLKIANIFDIKNLNRLKVAYLSSIIMGIIYMLNSIVIVIGYNKEFGWMTIYLILSMIITLVFLIFGIGLVVLSEIYRKAIQYKEENELTI